jgi:epsilon-lactone hydrolase
MDRMQSDPGNVLAFPQAADAIELRHMRAFVAVAEELNFGRAAERLYLSQPALSRQIRALERLMGCELLRRTTHRVELTLAGESLLDRARRLLRDVDEAVTATQAIGGELISRAARMWAPLADLDAADADIQELRTAHESISASFEPPPDLGVRSVIAGGVPAFVLSPPQTEEAVTLLYLHGGGHVMGSAYGTRALTGALAGAAGTRALAVEYRLAPEHPFPAGLEDAVRAYQWLLEGGTSPEHVTVAGDSSGAGLTMSLLISLRDRGLPLPGGAVLFCPWVDLTGATLAHLPDDAPLAGVLREASRRFAAAYLGGHPVDDPVVSPLTADLGGLPPMLIQAATRDAQLEDAHRLAERARSHGVDARLQLYPADTHVFQVFWSFLPEAANALEDAGAFARTLRSAGEPVARAAARAD